MADKATNKAEELAKALDSLIASTKALTARQEEQTRAAANLAQRQVAAAAGRPTGSQFLSQNYGMPFQSNTVGLGAGWSPSAAEAPAAPQRQGYRLAAERAASFVASATSAAEERNIASVRRRHGSYGVAPDTSFGGPVGAEDASRARLSARPYGVLSPNNLGSRRADVIGRRLPAEQLPSYGMQLGEGDVIPDKEKSLDQLVKEGQERVDRMLAKPQTVVGKGKKSDRWLSHADVLSPSIDVVRRSREAQATRINEAQPLSAADVIPDTYKMQGAQPPPLPRRATPPPLPWETYKALPPGVNPGEGYAGPSGASPPPMSVRQLAALRRPGAAGSGVAGPGGMDWSGIFGGGGGTNGGGGRGGGGTGPEVGGGIMQMLRWRGLNSTMGGHIGGMAGQSGAFGAGSAGGAAMAGVGGLVMAFKIVEGAANKGAQALSTHGNSAMTAAQKNEEYAKLLVPGAETFIRLRDAANGVTDALGRAQVKLEETKLGQQAAHEKARAEDRGQSEIRAQQARAGALRGMTVPQAPLGERSTYQGEIAFQEEATRYPHKVAIARAEAEHKAARDTTHGEQRRYNELIGRRQDLADKARRARMAVGAEEKREGGLARRGDGSVPLAPAGGAGGDITAVRRKAERTEKGAEAQAAINDQLLNEQRILEQSQRLKAAGVTEAEKESAVRKANNALLQNELQILQQKEQRISATQERIGGMSPVQRRIGLEAARHVKRHGLEATPMEMRAAAAQFAPEWMRKEQQKAGGMTAEAAAGRAEGFHDKEDLEAVRKEVQKVQTQVQVNVTLDEAALAEKMAQILAKSLQGLITGIEARFKAELGRMQENRQRARNEGRGG